jgi:hypothetical protein
MIKKQLILLPIQALLFTVFLCLFSLQSIAFPDKHQQGLQDALRTANQLKLYEKTTWLRLLHIKKAGRLKRNSDIISPTFFLSGRDSLSNISPKKELHATLDAFFLPANNKVNDHAQCRFPARFFWLKKQLNLTVQGIPNIKCERLERWAKFSSLDSISLVLVGGYFGNPASTFGHLLVKLNNSEYKKSSGNLLDQSINYGAQVPDREPIPLYIVKGLLGGYVSRFRDKAFYKQDRVYSRQELRDMWEYELALTTEQQRFLLYHLWEVMGMKSTYYFLKKNCAYRVAELLELVTGETLTADYQPWYLPIRLFQDLTDIEQSRYIKQITFLPSNQRKLYYQFDQLQTQDAQLVNTLLADDKALTQVLLKDKSIPRQAKIIELMLAYYQYKLIDTDQDKIIRDTLKKRKHQLLLLRLQLPIIKKDKHLTNVPKITSPATGSKPRLFSVGYGYQKKGHFLTLGVTGIHYDLLTKSYGTLANSELKVFDLRLKSIAKEALVLDYFNLLRIQKLNISPSPLYAEDDLSWRVAVGIKARNKQCDECNSAYVLTGMGKAWQVSSQVITYLMLDIQYHAKENDVLVSPNIGFVVSSSNRLKSVVEIGLETNIKNGKKEQKIEWQTRYSFSNNDAIRLSYEKQNNALSVSYYHHW